MFKILIFLFQPFFLPHLLLFSISKEKEKIINDIYGSAQPPNKGRIYYDLSYKLANSKYFRTLFYFRINNIGSKILRIFFPRDNRFIIDINTKLGGGVILAHPYGTIINAEEVGKNLYINQLITVGESNGLRPRIGDNVKLFSNCCVIGDVKVGNHAVVGAGAVVVKDVPEYAVVAGNPAKVLKYNYPK